MTLASPRPERAGQLTARILLALVLALLTLHAGQPPHVHKATTPGAYNEEHVLASLESVVGDVPLPEQGPAIAVALSTRAPVLAPDRHFSSEFAQHADSRAPPLA